MNQGGKGADTRSGNVFDFRHSGGTSRNEPRGKKGADSLSGNVFTFRHSGETSPNEPRGRYSHTLLIIIWKLTSPKSSCDDHSASPFIG